MTNVEAMAVLNKSKNNRLLFHDGERIAWTADDMNSGNKYVALFYASDQRPIVEDKALWNSKLVTYKPGEQSTQVMVNIAGAQKLYLVVTDGGNGNDWDHADWIEPKLIGKNGILNLTDVKWRNASAGWGSVSIDESVGGNPLIVDNKKYANGIGTHAVSIIEYDMPAGYDSLAALAGLDKECVDHTEGATVRFHVFDRYPTGNPPEDSIKVTVRLEQLGITGTCTIRDLWAKNDLGKYTDEISLYVHKHGARLLKITCAK